MERVFILGAGVSRELKFRSTARDVNYITSKNHFELGPLSDGFFFYVNNFNKKIPEISPIGYGVKIYESLGDYIIKYYKNKYDCEIITLDEILNNEQKSKKINIEELFGYIEEDIGRHNSNSVNAISLMDHPYQMKIDLMNYIFDAFSTISNYCFSIYHSIFANYIARNQLAVISLNWDMLFDEAMYYTNLWNYKDGYGLGIDNIFAVDGAPYDGLHNIDSKSLILKPHGSINWYFRNNGSDVIDSENLTLFMPLSRERALRGGNSQRLKNFMYEKQADINQNQYKNILIPPGRKGTTELKIYAKIWSLTKKVLENADAITIIGFSFNKFDEYISNEFKQIKFKKNIEINIVDPNGNLLVEKFKDIFKTSSEKIKVIHANFSCYCKWIIQQSGMEDLKALLV